jgi:hypothetical protein
MAKRLSVAVGEIETIRPDWAESAEAESPSDVWLHAPKPTTRTRITTDKLRGTCKNLLSMEEAGVTVVPPLLRGLDRSPHAQAT